MIVRAAILADCLGMADVLNPIIRAGGTSAFEVEKSAEALADWYLSGPYAWFCHVACDTQPNGVERIVGYQTLSRWGDFPAGWSDIGTFVATDVQRGGVGKALFAVTLRAARLAYLRTLNATIRADNLAGLGYYTRRGFVEYDRQPDYALTDGRIVGRVLMRFDLGRTNPAVTGA